MGCEPRGCCQRRGVRTVMIMTVFAKSTVRPLPSVSRPSSITCSMVVSTEMCAFSTSSKSTTVCGLSRFFFNQKNKNCSQRLDAVFDVRTHRLAPARRATCAAVGACTHTLRPSHLRGRRGYPCGCSLMRGVAARARTDLLRTASVSWPP
eukprot:SAG11_NODE_6403_length_1321_cov_0.905892_1_plen_149_part_10